jgi:hypothetical protein
MPIIKKPVKAKTKKPVRKAIKTKSTALVKAKNSKAKNTLAYYQCLCHQTKQGLKGKRITKACHDCKHNALAINAKMSAQKLKDVKKLAQAHANFKQILEEYVQKH